MSKFATIEEAIEDVRAGRMVVVCDDEDRENEGDLTLAATTLGRLRPGDVVNLEADVLAKYVERLVAGRGIR